MSKDKINKAKDMVAKSYGLDGWITVERLFEKQKLTLIEFNWMVNEAMRLYCKAEAEEVIDKEEIWDKYSERIGEDIDSLQFFAGRDVITKEMFSKMMNSIAIPIQSVKEGAFSIGDVKRIFSDYSTYRNSEEMHNGKDPLEFEEWADKYLQPKEGVRDRNLAHKIMNALLDKKQVQAYRGSITDVLDVIECELGVNYQSRQCGREKEFAEWMAKRKCLIVNSPKGNGDYMWFMTKDSIGQTTSELFELFLKQNSIV